MVKRSRCKATHLVLRSHLALLKLKVAAPAIRFSLAELFNNSLLAGKLPRDWTRANVRVQSTSVD